MTRQSAQVTALRRFAVICPLCPGLTAVRGTARGQWDNLLRVRASHVRDHIGELPSQKALGAARLDLVLRGIALPPWRTGKRARSGLVLPDRLEDLNLVERTLRPEGAPRSTS